MTDTTLATVGRRSSWLMISDSFRSQWTKLGRRNVLLGGIGTVVAFAVLLTIVGLINANDPSFGAGPDGGGFPGADVTSAGGWLAGLETAASFIGITALAVFAANIAAEFKSGTIRVLLSTQPRRQVVLVGITIALSCFIVVCVLYASVASAVASAVLADSQGVDSGAWWTGDGVLAGLGTVVNVALAGIIYGAFGALLGLATRSSALAIASGIGYLLLAESLILGAIWSDAGAWLPAGVLSSLAAGGTMSRSYGGAVLLSVAWGLAALVAASVIFHRRDITD